MHRRNSFSFTVRRDDAPAPVTLELVNQTIQSAIGNLLKTDLPSAVTNAVKGFDTRFTGIEELLKKSAPVTETAPPNDPSLDPKVQTALHEERKKREALEKSVKELTTQNEASRSKAEAAERESAIRTAMSNYNFLNDKAKDSAYKLLSLEVKRNSDGQLIGGENLTLDAFVTDFLTVQNDHFLAGKEVPGTGATRGKISSTSKLGMEDIKGGMKPETRADVLSQIQAVLSA